MKLTTYLLSIAETGGTREYRCRFEADKSVTQGQIADQVTKDLPGFYVWNIEELHTKGLSTAARKELEELPLYASLQFEQLRAPAPAPIGPATTPVQEIALDLIDVVSNVRAADDAGFKETELADLANSIRANGVLQNVTLRPAPFAAGRYELVCGERRYRAAKLAGLATIPAAVRNLDDAGFLELQLLENNQRRDPNPADEAVGFARLLALGRTPEQIAGTFGRSEAFVKQRAALATLTPEWLADLRSGRLTIKGAVQLAGLSEAQQKRAKENIYSGSVTGATVTTYINQNVSVALHGMVFPKDDATLVPKAGPCTTCPKRTGAQTHLFGEAMADDDRCLDVPCSERKRAAFVDRRKLELSADIAAGNVVLGSGEYGAKVKPGVLDRYDWKETSMRTISHGEEVKLVLVVSGLEAGTVKKAYVPTKKLAQQLPMQQQGNAFAPVDAGQVVQAQKAQRAAERRESAIERRMMGLMIGEVQAALDADGPVAERVHHFLIDDKLRSLLYGGSREVKAAREIRLRDGYGWDLTPVPVEEAKAMGYHHSEESALYVRELAKMPLHRKYALAAEIHLLAGWDASEIRESILKRCAGLGLDLEAVRTAATAAYEADQAARQAAKTETTADVAVEEGAMAE